MAGALDDWVGFRPTCDVMSGMLIIFLITYFFTCDGVACFKKSIANTKMYWGTDGPEHKVLIDESSFTDEDSDK